MDSYRGWSLQALFNKVSRHLIRQNERAELETCFGKYAVLIDAQKRRCAYGCLNTVKEHNSGQMYKSPYGKVTAVQNALMEELEDCHDYVKPNKWPPRLRAIARKNKLNIPDFLSASTAKGSVK